MQRCWALAGVASRLGVGAAGGSLRRGDGRGGWHKDARVEGSSPGSGNKRREGEAAVLGAEQCGGVLCGECGAAGKGGWGAAGLTPACGGEGELGSGGIPKPRRDWASGKAPS